MKPATVAGIALMPVLSACCSHLIHIETFRQSPLEQQISEYERGHRERCIPREGRGLLDSIMSDHGVKSADAMTELLKHPNPDFPFEDVMVILVHVHWRGIDLRNHESMRVLAEIAATASDPEVRTEAKDTLEKIKNHDPRGAHRQSG
jgi:hypothetical protein